jgi:hypothetical protein
MTNARVCPLHKTSLVYIDIYKLGCTGKVRLKNGGSIKCQHIEYTTMLNPTVTRKTKLDTIIDKLKTQIIRHDYENN